MASRQSLRKIGEEGFKLLDQADGKQRLIYHPSKPVALRDDHLYPPHLGQNGYHVQVIPTPTVDKEDYYGGVMDCYEAAKRFGGMVVTDYYPNKRIQVKKNNRAY